MIRRALALCAVAAVAVLFGSSAYAQTYNAAVLGTETTRPAPGQSFAVNGTGCVPGAPVAFAIDGQPAGGTTADPNGNFSGRVTAPNAPGPHTVTATCGARVLSVDITVGAAAATTPLPRTGSSSTIPMTSIALGLLAVGGLLVLTARRRRPTASHAA